MKKALVLGGIGLVSLIGTLFAYNTRKTVKMIPRDTILQTIKALRKQMYPILLDIASFVQEHASHQSPEKVKQALLNSDGLFKQRIDEVLTKIFSTTSEDDFQENIEKFYKQDVEIQYYLKRYQEQFQKSFLGVTPQYHTQVITFFTPEKVLKIVQELLDFKMAKLEQKITEKITFKQMILILKAQQQQQKDERVKKLQAEGLIGKQEQITEIFEFLVGKYLRLDQNFKQKYEKITGDFILRSNEYVDEFVGSFPRSTSSGYIKEQEKQG